MKTPLYTCEFVRSQKRNFANDSLLWVRPMALASDWPLHVPWAAARASFSISLAFAAPIATFFLSFLEFSQVSTFEGLHFSPEKFPRAIRKRLQARLRIADDFHAVSQTKHFSSIAITFGAARSSCHPRY